MLYNNGVMTCTPQFLKVRLSEICHVYYIELIVHQGRRVRVVLLGVMRQLSNA
jgi:hypothetical protein